MMFSYVYAYSFGDILTIYYRFDKILSIKLIIIAL